MQGWRLPAERGKNLSPQTPANPIITPTLFCENSTMRRSRSLMSPVVAPTPQHEAPLVLFRENPDLVTRLLDLVHVDVPEDCHVVCGGEDRTEVVAATRRIDALLTYVRGERNELGVIVEVQRRPDPDKQWSWPAYLANVRSDLRCPTVLPVLTMDPRTEKECRLPIHLGHPELVLHPLVIGPGKIPLTPDPTPDNVELAVLSALLNSASPDAVNVLTAAMTTLDAMGDNEKAKHYAELILSAVPDNAKHIVEALMKSGTWEFQSDYAKSLRAEGLTMGLAEGEARGLVNAVLRVLKNRGIHLTGQARQHILDCTDIDQANTWLDRATTAHTIEDILKGRT